jgi:hypothetical protein
MPPDDQPPAHDMMSNRWIDITPPGGETGLVTDRPSRPAFPLRFRDEGLRDLVREVARHERVSQNDLIEQAVANEVVARGAVLARDLATAAKRLAGLRDEQLDRLVARSVATTGAAEGAPDPLAPVALPARAAYVPRDVPTAARPSDVLAAFDAGRRG